MSINKERIERLEQAVAGLQEEVQRLHDGMNNCFQRLTETLTALSDVLHRSQQMKIFIITEAGRTLTIEAGSSDTIGSVMAQIQNIGQGTPPGEQGLVFNEKVLEDGQTLADYNIQNESTLLLSRVGMQITVIGTKRDTVTLEVKSLDTMKDLRNMFKAKVGYGGDDGYCLSTTDGKKLLEDERSLAYYNIEDGSSVRLFDTYAY